jgi:thiol-disulfide isomerase/thioredoxin
MFRLPLRAFLITLPLLIVSCAAPKQTVAPPETMELGLLDRSFMLKPGYRPFAVTYDTVEVSADVVELIRMVQPGAEFLVFLGTWCGDSKREVPRFMKIADMAGIPADRIRLCGVDRAKKSPDGLAAPYEIVRVPTFIVFRNGKEEGRIVERPLGTLEGDLLTILARQQNR